MYQKYDYTNNVTICVTKLWTILILHISQKQTKITYLSLCAEYHGKFTNQTKSKTLVEHVNISKTFLHFSYHSAIKKKVFIFIAKEYNVLLVF